MKGLIYKEISLFFKSFDKKLIIIAAAAVVEIPCDKEDAYEAHRFF